MQSSLALVDKVQVYIQAYNFIEDASVTEKGSGWIQHYALPVIGILTFCLITLLIIFIGYLKRMRMLRKEQEKTRLELEEALRAAELASESKTAFLSNMSHDIRTPMNIIAGMAAIANENLDDRRKVSDCLDKISVSSRHLQMLINDVLDISKIESGKIVLNPVRFSLINMVDALVNIVQPMIAEKNLEFNTHIYNMEYEMVLGDEVRLNQVFINILTNAVKYTPDYGKVDISLEEEALQDNRKVRLIYTVEDTGIGMSEEFMENMFETYTRAEDMRAGDVQGTGLGLAIVKRIVDIMDGTITCESEEEKGTKITVCVELETVTEEQKRSAKRPVREERKKEELRDLHLLVAEDNDLNWEVISELLKMRNITADRAENGQICVAMLTKAAPGTYDAVIMDVQMPVMNGLEAARVIRSDERESIYKIPIIAMTADAFAEDITACLNAGMSGHVSKPVDMSLLLQELKNCVPRT